MKSEKKEVYYESWKQVKKAFSQLRGQQYRARQQISSIVLSIFGTDNYQGIIAKRLPYYFQKDPTYWAQQLNQIVQMFSYESDLISGPKGLVQFAEYQTTINPKTLPKIVIDQFSQGVYKSSSILKSLKKEGDQFTINIWQWFWVTVANALINLPQIEQKRSLQQQHREDQMYYLLSRNPILLILHKALQTNFTKYRNNNLLMQRLRGIFQIFIIEDLINYVKYIQFRQQYKYQLRSHNLAAIFLLIDSRRTNLKGETLQIYHDFFQRAFQGFSIISPTTKNNNLRNLIRTWTFFITRECGLDYYIVKQLEKANPKTGCFRLQRCPIQNWIGQAKKVQMLTKEIPPVSITRTNIYRLLRTSNEWTPSFSFLSVLQQFIELDKKRLASYIKKLQQYQENEITNKCFQRILIYLAENGADCNSLRQLQSKLNLKFVDSWDRKININFMERSQQAKYRLFKSSREAEKTINYLNTRLKNVWEYQRQQNQYQTLLRASRWLASKIDKLIPGHQKRKYPCINIRIFANPYIFLLTVLLVCLVIRSYIK